MDICRRVVPTEIQANWTVIVTMQSFFLRSCEHIYMRQREREVVFYLPSYCYCSNFPASIVSCCCWRYESTGMVLKLTLCREGLRFFIRITLTARKIIPTSSTHLFLPLALFNFWLLLSLWWHRGSFHTTNTYPVSLCTENTGCIVIALSIQTGQERSI